MPKEKKGRLKLSSKKSKLLFMAIFLCSFIFFLFGMGAFGNISASYKSTDKKEIADVPTKPIIPPLDKVAYDKKMEELANNPAPKVVEPKIDPKTGEALPVKPPKPNIWPVKGPYPNDGAILPFKRIIAYYGNLYSTKMGVLGEYEESVMIEKLKTEVKKWETADPSTPAIPALHYIVTTAQGSAGADGKYRFRMPDKEIDKVLKMAEKIDAIVFLDIQVGLSNLQSELPVLEKYLKMPNVHLGIDPEFSMKTGAKPGKVIGTFDAVDINYASSYLSSLVKENNLTPKILVIHRFTRKMLTNYKNIKLSPEVQIVIDMDGWGGKAKKIGTYKNFIYPEPIQFTGFKLFYKNDVKEAGTSLLTPKELLELNPRPIYIQYQ
ncbi:MAG TPA: hypothetical protein PKZ36_03060 [Candidatus Paceibacterota bacterium]|nr:hypothetical protein [Candidatus Paceibacterota bacterium]HPT18359.1 hypothetical protein [Candidatus Paceibacterota bacterium]